MVLSACMMLNHVGERQLADRIMAAVEQVVTTGEVQTYDMKKLRGSPAALEQGAASTVQMTDAIIAAL